MLALLYFGIVLLGLIPVNNGFREPAEGVEILIVSSSVHADIVMPIRAGEVDWRAWLPEGCFRGDTSAATHVAIGWGEKGFFIGTPTWSDLRVSTAAKALFWPSGSCMHVTMTSARQGPSARRVTISREQYGRLVEAVRGNFARDAAEQLAPISDSAYWSNDAFFEARGVYHCLNTCNSWAGRCMRAAGIRTAWLTPLPKTVFLYLPDRPAREAAPAKLP